MDHRCEHIDHWKEQCKEDAWLFVAEHDFLAQQDVEHWYCRDHIGHHLDDYSGSTDYSYTVWRPC